jgi:M6 family metalloprotease-like protein
LTFERNEVAVSYSDDVNDSLSNLFCPSTDNAVVHFLASSFVRSISNELSILGLTCSLGLLRVVDSGMASPYPFRLMQPTGSMTPKLMLHGGPNYHIMTDTKGYTVIEDDKATVVYAMKNATNGNLISSGMMVGNGNPANSGIPKRLVPNETSKRLLTESLEWEAQPRRLFMPPMLKNLVIPIRFSDHKHRTLPSRDDIDILFNEEEGHPILAPTGSIRDVFTANSYGKFTLDSEVFGWVDLPETEAYYADGVSGYGTDHYYEALEYALNHLEDELGVNFGDFDADGDNMVDMVTMIHSGYAAEVPGTDADGAEVKDRIWSHRWLLPGSKYWPSSSGVLVHQYSTSPSLWDLSGTSIGRIGVIAHEIGHCLSMKGLPDLYGTIFGDGAGSYDIMSNHWGFGPHALRQLYPPMMSPWTKMKAGWLEPTLIEQPGTYTIQASVQHDLVYRINLNELGTEYLLIENRQPIDFDMFLPQGGLAIWHIDEEAPNVEGYPGQPGPWPENGKHYRVALVQADGEYDLERGNDRGDSGDLFHEYGVNSLGPSASLEGGPFPNTDAYQDGTIRNTGIRIFDISESALTMFFSVDMTPSTLSPTEVPTSAPTIRLRELFTTFFDNNGAQGNMFDVLPKRDMMVHKLDLHIATSGPTIVEVWMKLGTHVSFENDLSEWSRRVALEVEAKGLDSVTSVDVGSIPLLADELHSLYVFLLPGKLRYTNGVGVGSIVAANDDLIIYEGVGKSAFFGNTFNNRIWNGAIHYALTPRTPSPTSAPADQLSTTYAGGSGQAGNMFDVLAYQDVSIKGFDLHIYDQEEVAIEILTKTGSFIGSERSCEDWTLVADTTVLGSGVGEPTHVSLDASSPVLIQQGHFRAFYVTVKGGTGMRYSPGIETDTLFVHDSHLAIFEGAGTAYRCGPTFWNRVWNGAIYYEAVKTGLSPNRPTDPETDSKEIEISIMGWGIESSANIEIVANRPVMIMGVVVVLDSMKSITIQVKASLIDPPEPWTTLLFSSVLTGGQYQHIYVESSKDLVIPLQRNATMSLVLNVTGSSNERPGILGHVMPTFNEDLILSDASDDIFEVDAFPEIPIAKVIVQYLIIDM